MRTLTALVTQQVRNPVNDFVFVLISIAFFALAAGYAWFCERLG